MSRKRFWPYWAMIILAAGFVIAVVLRGVAC